MVEVRRVGEFAPPIATFGDGLRAQINSRKRISFDGKPYEEIKFLVSRIMREVHSLEKDDVIIRKFPIDIVIDLKCPDPFAGKRVLILQDINNGETSMTDLFSSYLISIKNLRNENAQLKMETGKLSEDLRIAKERGILALKDSGRMFKVAKEIVGDYYIQRGAQVGRETPPPE